MKSVAGIPMRSNSLETSQNISNILLDSSNNKSEPKESKESIRLPQDRNYTITNPYKDKYLKLSQTIKVVYLSVKRRLMKEDPQCVPHLKDTVSLEEDDETVVKKDSVQLAQYLKKIYEKTVELKNEEKKKLVENNDKSMSQYEPHLQKLEAEVRKHIQIEQQMKILIENQQDRIRELEKTGPKTNDFAEQEIQALKQEYNQRLDESDKQIKDLEGQNTTLREQLRNSQSEILKLRSALGSISLVLRDIESK